MNIKEMLELGMVITIVGMFLLFDLITGLTKRTGKGYEEIVKNKQRN